MLKQPLLKKLRTGICRVHAPSYTHVYFSQLRTRNYKYTDRLVATRNQASECAEAISQTDRSLPPRSMFAASWLRVRSMQHAGYMYIAIM